MTLTYLAMPATVQFDNKGNGTVEVGPDTGQYWYPSEVRVGTASQATTPYCALFHSNPAVVALPGDFVDDTYAGNNDVTGMFNGVCVQTGETIVARWANGIPMDTGIVKVFGLSSDMPPGSDNLSALLARSTGVRFRNGAPANGQLWINDSQINITQDVVYGPFYVANVKAMLLGGTASGWNALVTFTWGSDQNMSKTIGASSRYWMNGCTMYHTLRPAGPWCTATVHPAASMSYYMALSTIEDVTLPASSFQSIHLINQTNATVPAGPGGVATYTSNICRTGSGVWSVAATGGNWVATLNETDYNGVVSIVDRIDSNGPSEGVRQIYLSGAQPSITITNNFAGATASAFAYLSANAMLGL